MTRNVRGWYMGAFPSDTLGEEINPKISIEDVIRALDNQKDVYEYIGVWDSLVRERIFEELTKISGESYDVFYNAWLYRISLDESRRMV